MLVFTYTVVNGESDTDGISIAANSLGGTIRDADNQNATLTHDAVAADSGHPVEGVKPVLQTATVDGNIVTLTYNETLRGSSTPAASAFTVTAGGGTVTVNVRPGVRADRHADPERACDPEPDRDAELYLPIGATDSGLVRQRRGVLLQPGGDEHHPGTALRHRR